MESVRFYAMGTDIEVLMDAEEDAAWSAFSQVPVWFEEWEQHLSRFRPESELSYVNNQTEHNTHVSAIFAEVMNLSLQIERQSAGLITPAILPALIQAGYNHSFEKITGNDSQTNHEIRKFPISTQGIQWDSVSREIYIPQGIQLDFGGVAKGWAAHQAAQRLSVYGPVLVNAGGDIATAGYQIDPLTQTQAKWQVGVRNPFEHDVDFTVMDLYQGGVATSGIDHRNWQQNGVFRHHLINPANGQPAESDLIQVTVLASDVMQAEMAAKIIFFKGRNHGMQWLENNSQFEAILMDRDGHILKTKHISLNTFEVLKV